MDRDFEERERVRLEEQYEKRLRGVASQAREEELAKQMAMLRELQGTQNHFLSEILCRMPAPAPTPYYVPARHAHFHEQSTSDNTENGVFTPLSSSSFLQLEWCYILLSVNCYFIAITEECVVLRTTLKPTF